MYAQDRLIKAVKPYRGFHVVIEVMLAGLLFPQFLTLFVTPVFFLYMECIRSKITAALMENAVLGENPS